LWDKQKNVLKIPVRADKCNKTYSMVIVMTGIIGKISALLGFRRDGKVLAKGKRKSGRMRRESDTVTISEEARRLFADGPAEESMADGERIK
jgi:hypothetical protein